MKKIFVTLMLMVLTFVSMNAQIVVSCNSNVARIDMNGDGIWDTEMAVGRVPGISYMRTGRNFYSELGRIYVINQWKMYERMGQNPANYLPDPSGNGDFTQYAGAYSNMVGMGGGAYYGGGMVGGYGMPGNVSVSVGGKNFGVNLSVPVRNRNSNVGNMMYTPNASLGVNINGNYVGASVPVSVVTGKKNTRTQTTNTVTPAQTQTRTVTVPATQTRTVTVPATRTQTRTVTTQPQTNTRVVEMSVDEVAQMMNSGSYM